MSKQSLSLVTIALSCLAQACADDPSITVTENALSPAPGERLPRGRSNPPALTRLIDRTGRPEISAALVAAFEPDEEARREAQRRYNAASLDSTEFRATFEKSLALIDGIDGVCGNQLWPDPTTRPRYRSLASLLLDDQIYVHGRRLGGSVYLGLEAEAAGVLDGARGAAGGRAPGLDVVQTTYSALVTGALSGVDDGIVSDDAAHDPTSFPFLADP
jgi:hypothetical protein